jgi:hypothetical protein
VRRKLTFIGVVLSLAVEAFVVRRRSGSFAGRTIVRCRDGHLFTTLWIPGASVKALRLGWWRLQRCPVGRHWTLVTPADVSTLGPLELRQASRELDTRLP